jgi:hypothetical protein
MSGRYRLLFTLLVFIGIGSWGCAKGVGKAVCGDGTCTTPTEDLANCPADCTPAAECGNGDCEPGETAENCFADCDPALLCGNDEVDPGEHCDGANLEGMTCAGLSAGEGTLMCSSVCRFDLSLCNGTCVDQCSGAVYSRCNGNTVEECQRGANGCYQWLPTQDCAGSEQICDDADGSPACADSCSDACVAGSHRCFGNLIQDCATGANGCLQWVDASDCSAVNRVCVFDGTAAVCEVPCADACDTAGVGMCLADVRQECVLGASGCLEFQEDQDCVAIGKYCTGGECVCADVCTAGQSRCSGNIIQSCTTNANGCRVWTDGTSCATTSQVCNDSSGTAVCATQCTNVCSSGQTQCSGALVQNCQLLGTGCWGWVDGTNCAASDKLCTSGACVCDNQCDPGERSCMMVYYAYECVQDGNGCWDWGNEEFCMISGQICLLGYCITP